MKFESAPYPPRMYMRVWVPNGMNDPASFRRMALSAPATDHELVAESYRSTSPTAFGHWPHPATTMSPFRGPAPLPNACVSSLGSIASATPASFQVPVGGFHDSTIVWPTSCPAELTSPPMA